MRAIKNQLKEPLKNLKHKSRQEIARMVSKEPEPLSNYHRERMDTLWMEMTNKFGGLWIDNFTLGSQEDWGRSLSDKTDAELRMGLQHITDNWDSSFPPSQPVFKKMCVISLDDIGLGDELKSWERCCHGRPANQVEVLVMELSGMSHMAFAKYFDLAANQYLRELTGKSRGRKLVRLLEMDADPEKAIEAMKEIKAILGIQ